MTTNERYRVTLTPGRNVEKATIKLAKYIIDRWMPGNAGGVLILLGPQLCQLLHPSFIKCNERGKNIVLEIDTSAGSPVISEIK